MSSDRETAAPSPPPRVPSVFISYASEDRTAARTLRDTLTTAGLEVWYDEQELGGGDAWDQKIRRQIRDCDYFMPVISATTEARKEGYFRREWRLASERTLDMADDVLFLIPVTIDGTGELGARVPDKFLAVQWLRLPAGQPTPALHHLVRRILAGDHHALTRPPMAYAKTVPPFGQSPIAAPPLLSPPPGDAAEHSHPPAMPPFPHPPEKGGFGHTLRFLAEAFWWLLTAAWLLFKRLPRWARVLLTIWIVLTLMSRCSSSNVHIGDNPRPSASRKRAETNSEETQKAIREVADQIAQAAREARKSRNPSDLARIGNEIAKKFESGPPEGGPLARRLVLAPFARASAEGPGDKFANAVFAALYGRLILSHGREVGLLRQLPPEPGEAALLARGKASGSSYILAGRPTDADGAAALAVRLLVVADGSVAWTKSFPVESSEPTAVADQIADAVAAVLPKK